MSILQAPEEVAPQFELPTTTARQRKNVASPASASSQDHSQSDPLSDPLSNSLSNSLWDSLCRQAVLHRLSAIEAGRLRLREPSQTLDFGPASSTLQACITVNHPRFYRSVVLGGSIGAAEAYIRGDWDADDLTRAMQILARKAATMSSIESRASRWLRPWRAAMHWLRRNTPSGSKRNISAHYDLSNDFFALMLDPTMTYSSGVFRDEQATLEEASREKYDRICRKLQLTPDDHVLEIGTGWGGFAEHAASVYGCRVTTTTISDAQYAYAAERFRGTAWEDRITLLNQDYRNLEGTFDKLVSIEMIEAVGERYLHTYFEKCCQRLRPDGMMVLQAITIPDHRYDRYRKSMDFIQKYIFPGGFLPSMRAMSEAIASRTDFRFLHTEDFGPHYARTLELWKENFQSRIEDVRTMGFDERFERTWEYYLSYCEAGFRERQIGVTQLLLSRPEARRVPLLTV